MARAQWAAEPFYRAADVFVQECLRTDGSMFMPGKPIWTSGHLDALHYRFVQQPDESAGEFFAKLKGQLQGASPEVVQLAAEVVFVLLLPQDISAATKREQVATTLSWLPQTIEVPTSLDAALGQGIATYGAALAHKFAQYSFLVEFGRAWKALDAMERDRLLDELFEFRGFLHSLPRKAASSQVEALQHLVFPDAFEPIVSVPVKERIAKTFSSLVEDQEASLDERLAQIRRRLTEQRGESFSFYDPEIRAQWGAKDQSTDVLFRGSALIPDPATFVRSVLRDSTPERVEVRGAAEAEARAILEEKAGRMEVEDFRSLFGHLNADFGGGRRIAGRFAPAFVGASADRLIEQVESLNGWTRRLFDQDEEQSLAALGELVGNRSLLGGAGTSYPTILMYLRDPSRWAYWGPTTDRGLRALGGYDGDPPNRGSRQSYQEFSQAATALIDAFDVAPEQVDLVLAAAGRVREPATTGSDEPASSARVPAATERLAADLLVGREWLDETVGLLNEKGQVIFYGPPGTGKTYIAQALGTHVEEAGGTWRIVQFHPAYSYEDFFEGYRPFQHEEGGALAFRLRHGPLREMADVARSRADVPHLLVIDEINRGNLPKIFGELYFLLEYRDRGVRLQYSPEDGFSLPENLFFIGTMNTADRSIALVDSALRRRFYFVPFLPQEDPIRGVLASWLDAQGYGEEPARLLDELNAVLADRGGGADEFAIGPSYFITKDGEPDVERVWSHAILPLLEERFYGALARDQVASEFGLAAIRARLERGQEPEPEPEAAVEPGAPDE